jgi:hypothetical protein
LLYLFTTIQRLSTVEFKRKFNVMQHKIPTPSGSTPGRLRVDSVSLLGGLRVGSGSAPGGLQVDSGWFPGQLRVDSGWASGRPRVISGSASGGFRVGVGRVPGRLGVGSVSAPGGLRVGSDQVGLDLAQATASQNRGDKNLQCVINLIQTPDLVNVLQEMPPLSTFVYI